MPSQALSKAEAVDLFDYDPETGSLAWKISPSRAVKIGAIAGTKNTSGHLQVMIKGKAFSAHRIIWLLTHGEWPIGQIDHINRSPSDNRLVNLRLANGTENSRNRNKHKNNKSGAKGVHPKGKKYQAQIQVDGVVLTIGTFSSVEEASEAYKAAARMHFGSFAAD